MHELGQQIGDYTLVKRLGEGGMGVVYEALHAVIGRRVALKLFHPELAQSPHLGARFLTEARAANQVQHPGLGEVHDYGQSRDGSTYLIMELVDGESLARRLEGLAAPLPAQQGVRIAQEVAQALAAAHQQGVIHRDIKPANIMLAGDGVSSGCVKVLDFGVAKLLEGPQPAAGRTRNGVLIGTPEYMSPEQCRADAVIDATVDVYALGVMLFELLSGRRPFYAASTVELMTMHLRTMPPSLMELEPALPAPLVGLVHRMLAKQPADRPAMSAVADELLRLLPELSALPRSAISKAAPPSPTVADSIVLAPPAAPKNHSDWLILIVGVTAAIILQGLLFGRGLWKRESRPSSSLPAAALFAPPAVAPPAVTPPAETKAQAKVEPEAPAVLVEKALTPAASTTRSSRLRKSSTTRVIVAPATPDTDAIPLLMRHKEPDGP